VTEWLAASQMFSDPGTVVQAMSKTTHLMLLITSLFVLYFFNVFFTNLSIELHNNWPIKYLSSLNILFLMLASEEFVVKSYYHLKYVGYINICKFHSF
jgi:O-antigen/teichoic acid export membrane protein